MDHWRQAMLNLLQHFDDNEGTTYLYDEDARRRFVDGVDPEIRSEVEAMLEEYHAPDRCVARLAPFVTF